MKNCAEEDKHFRDIYEGMFPNSKNGYISEADASKLLDAFRLHLVNRINACGMFNQSCQDPYRRMMALYDFDNLLQRANGRLDAVSELHRQNRGGKP
jgi:hypothetical protein